MDCTWWDAASAVHAASPATSPSTSSVVAAPAAEPAAATPASGEAKEGQRGMGPKVLDLARCLSTIDNDGAAGPKAEVCHSAHDPNVRPPLLPCPPAP